MNACMPVLTHGPCNSGSQAKDELALAQPRLDMQLAGHVDPGHCVTQGGQLAGEKVAELQNETKNESQDNL